MTRPQTRRARSLARVFRAATVDQLLAAARPVLLSLLIAQVADAQTFGHYAVAQTIVVVLRSTLMAATAQVLLMRPSAAQDEGQASSAFRAVLILSALSSVILAGIGALAPPGFSEAVLVVAVIGPPIYMVEFIRTLTHARSTPEVAARMNSLWFVTMAIGCTALAIADVSELTWYLAVWGGTAALAAAVFASRARITRPSDRWRRLHGRHGLSLASDSLLLSSSSQISTFLLSFTGGADPAGALKAVQVLFAPVGNWIQVIRLVALPRLGQRVATHTTKDLTGKVVAATFVPVATFCLGIYLASPVVGPRLFPASWELAQVAVPAIGIATCARSISAGLLMEVQTYANRRSLLVSRIIDSGATLIALIVGTSVAGLEGLAIGHAVANTLLIGLWMQAARLARRPAIASASTSHVPHG